MYPKFDIIAARVEVSQGVRKGAFCYAQERTKAMAEKKAAAKKPAQKKTAARKHAAKKTGPLFKGRVIYGALNIRTAPELAAGNITGVLKNASPVEVLEAKDGWYRIAEGWIMAKYVEKIEEEK